MERPYDIITFDCYGTLIDWEGGIRQALMMLAASEAKKLDPIRVIELYGELEPIVEADTYRTYRDVLTETALRVAERLEWDLSRERAGLLAASLPAWQPFNDTNPALERLAASGYTLGILSNVDDDLLASTRRHFRVNFDLLVTAQQVGSYKPAQGHFLVARQHVGPRRWLHAAQSYFHDVMPARTLGIPTAWINRKGEKAIDGGRAHRELRTLSELADWLC